ncbi:MAG: glycosyltransferase family 2 protein [Candidatus Omnitrophica bacterium]|nr:glycosyltransferase family 2 protein [Candidatus Omnitrophota bacterium]
MKTCIIIPTYNEAKTISQIVRPLCRQGLDVVVIDDGSKDTTASLASAEGATVLRNAENQGKGASLIRGFQHALSNGFEAVITMDGDGQHLPEDAAYFIRLAEHSQSSVLIGNRMSQAAKMPFLRILTNLFMSWLLSLFAGQRIPDTQCGLRLIKKDVLERVKLTTTKYETDSELIIQASRLGFKIESVPIKAIYAGEKSQINPLIDTLRFIRFMARQVWTTRN